MCVSYSAILLQKFRKFCSMVDKSRRVDVDGSLKEREWNTEEFYAVLNQHTEEVGQAWHSCILSFCGVRCSALVLECS